MKPNGRLIPIWLIALAVIFTACSPSSRQVKIVEESLSKQEEDAIAAVKRALEARNAAPATWSTSVQLTDAYLEARRYPEAYQEVQRLPGALANMGERQRLMGQAAIGLGWFDQASEYFREALTIDANDGQSVGWLASMLVARGEDEEARALLTKAIERWADWEYYDLLLSITPDHAQQLLLVDQYLSRRPSDQTVVKYRSALLASPSGHGRMLSGNAEIIRTDISDNLKISVKINNIRTRLLFDTTMSGIAIGDDLAARLDLVGKTSLIIRGLGGSGVAEAIGVVVQRFELGNVVLTDVPISVVQDLSSKYIDGVIGPDVFPNYSFQLDRKEETLVFYPPGTAIPGPKGPAITQPFYQIGPNMVTETTIRNRIDDRMFEAKMVIDTGSNLTILNRQYAHHYGYGKSVTTNSLLLKGLTGYSYITPLSFTELQLGGAAFAYEVFPAANMSRFGDFVPYGLLGRDVLSRFRITVNHTTHQVTFELYRGASGWSAQRPNIEPVGARVGRAPSITP